MSIAALWYAPHDSLDTRLTLSSVATRMGLAIDGLVRLFAASSPSPSAPWDARPQEKTLDELAYSAWKAEAAKAWRSSVGTRAGSATMEWSLAAPVW